MTRIVSLAIAVVICFCIWLMLVSFSTPTISNIIKVGLLTGIISFALGFFGPMLLFPEANQGPLLGVFITGPLGFIVGLMGGVIYWSFKKEAF